MEVTAFAEILKDDTIDEVHVHVNGECFCFFDKKLSPHHNYKDDWIACYSEDEITSIEFKYDSYHGCILHIWVTEHDGNGTS